MKFNQSGKEFEFNTNTDERGFNVVEMFIDGKFIDDEYITLGSGKDTENISDVINVLMERNGCNEPEEVVCPECNSLHKTKSTDNKGWWVYETGKWTCDYCGNHGKIWYAGKDISDLTIED